MSSHVSSIQVPIFDSHGVADLALIADLPAGLSGERARRARRSLPRGRREAGATRRASGEPVRAAGRVGHADVPAEVLDVRGVRTAFRRAGSGRPLLYLHGAGPTKRWLPLHGVLAESLDRIAQEHPDFGQTPVRGGTGP